jgi:hypothetical protein
MQTLSELSDADLVGRLVQIRKLERSLLVEFLRYLGEVDRRKTALGLGFPSLFSFCTDHLGLTEASAFRRTTGARLLARFPLVAEYLADGRLNLTTLVELRDVLDEAHLVEIAARFVEAPDLGHVAKTPHLAGDLELVEARIGSELEHVTGHRQEAVRIHVVGAVRRDAGDPRVLGKERLQAVPVRLIPFFE